MNDSISRSVAIRICEKAIDLCAGHPGVSMLIAVKDAIEHAPADQPDQLIDRINEWLDPDIDMELALERIRAIVYEVTHNE